MKNETKSGKKCKMYVENDPFSRVIVILTIQSEKKVNTEESCRLGKYIQFANAMQIFL